MRYSTITAIGAFTDVNTGSGNYLLLDPSRCAGLEDPDLRVEYEDAPGQDGIIVFPPLHGAQPITLGGVYVVSSGDYFAGADALEADLLDALNAMKSAPGDLVWPAGLVSVYKGSRYLAEMRGQVQKWCMFGLLAGDVL